MTAYKYLIRIYTVLLSFSLLACIFSLAACQPSNTVNTIQQDSTSINAEPVQPTGKTSDTLANTNPDITTKTVTNAPHILPAGFTYQIIPSARGTYGYDIFKDGKLIIHQSSIPALPGNNGFETKATAEAVAEAVIEKISKGEMPPTISTDELKELGVQAE